MVITICAISGPISKSHRSTYGVAQRTEIFLTTLIKLVISSIGGAMPVHSLAAGLFLDTNQIHYFEDFGYQHDLYRHCPSEQSQLGCRCDCPAGTNDQSIGHEQNWDTCLPNWKTWVKSDKARKAEWDFSYLEAYLPS